MFIKTPSALLLGLAFTVANALPSAAGISICSRIKEERAAVQQFLDINKSFGLECILQTNDNTRLYTFIGPDGERIYMEFRKNGLCTPREDRKRQCGGYYGM